MRGFILIALLIVTLQVSGQIVTDRPTQSFSPYIQPHGTVNIETGFVSERPFSRVDVYNVTYLNALVRYGLIDWLELRVTGNYVGTRTNGQGVNGWTPLTVGTKIHINDQTNNGFPQTGLLAHVTLQGNDENFGSTETVQDIRILLQEDVHHKFVIAANLGTFWSESQSATGVYSVMIAFSATDQLGIFLEPYGFFAKDTPGDQRFNAGFTYLVSDDFQLDASLGNGLTPRSPDYFLAFGASVRL